MRYSVGSWKQVCKIKFVLVNQPRNHLLVECDDVTSKWRETCNLCCSFFRWFWFEDLLKMMVVWISCSWSCCLKNVMSQKLTNITNLIKIIFKSTLLLGRPVCFSFTWPIFAVYENLSVDGHELCQCELVQHCTAKYCLLLITHLCP